MERKGNGIALLPLIIFLAIYIISGIVNNNFYKMPIMVAFLGASVTALAMNRKENINKRIEIFCKGAGNDDIILMCFIFMLAGAFAQVAKDVGAVDSTVNLGLSVLPANIIICGIFIIGCFISLSIGTSMGTIAALAPVAIGIASKTGITLGLAIGAVISGAMFGDNLSLISDTTIAATKTQGCEMRDKFKMNILIVLPAAIITAIIFIFINSETTVAISDNLKFDLIKVVPYIAVLITALMGINVIVVLIGGIVLSGFIGIVYGSFDVWGLLASISKGVNGMGEIIIISILVGGLVEIIKHNGGIAFIIQKINNSVHSKKGAEFGIAILVILVNMCTANNTIAIVMTGPLARDIGERYNIDKRRAASLLDIFSCFCQGIIPYGAQLLLAASLVGMSPIMIMKYLYYPYLMGICAVFAIIFGLPKIRDKVDIEDNKINNIS